MLGLTHLLKAASGRRHLATASGLLWLAMAILAPAHAQTSVQNTATIALPPGATVVDSNPTNNTSAVNVNVLALPRLTLIKQVINDNGGTAAASAWTLVATGASTTISGATGTATVTNAPVPAGTYALSETGGSAGYAAGTWSCVKNGGAAVSANSVSLIGGDVATCTIVNNDQAATLTLVKTVINDNGGTATVSNFPLTATGPTTITGVSGTAAVTNASVNAGVYTLSEVTAAGYAAGSWSCTAGTLSGNQLTLANGQSASCSITNDDQAATLTLVKTVINDNGGTATVSNFPLTATGPTTITGVSGTAAVTNASVNAGVYTLSEVTAAGYAAGSWSCTAGTLSGNQLTLANGQSANCSITNNDQAATLTLVKNVSGGPGVPSDWTLSATGPTPVSGAGGVTAVSVSAGTYTLAETGGPANNAYTASTWSCDAGVLVGDQLTLTNGANATCSITNTFVAPAVSYSKSASTTGPVAVGDTITYTLTTVVANSQTTAVTTLTDTLGTGLDFVAVGAQTSTDPANTTPFVCTGSLSCTLAAGTAPGTYTVSYTARVNAQAVGTVNNAVVGTNATCTTNCSTSTPVTAPAVSYSKSASTTGPVAVGDTITYTLTTVVANSQTTAVTTLTDTLGTGLDFVAVGAQTSTDPANTTPFVCTGSLSCTLAAGTAPGTYTVSYTARVNAQAVGTVNNAVVGTNATCTTNCSTSTPVTAPAVSYSKSASTTGPVAVGDTITYTLTTVVANSQTTAVTTLTDTLGTGLDFVAVGAQTSTDPANTTPFVCTGSLSCTLAAGTAPGTYTVSYTARVNAQAVGTVNNAVVGTNATCTTNCSTSTPVTAPAVSYSKSASTTGPVAVGDTITYTLTTVVANSQTTAVTTLTDTLGTGLDFVAVGAQTSTDPANTTPFVCTGSLSCTLAAGTAPGTYTVSYTARVNAQAVGTVNNAVVGTNATCTTNCSTSTPVTAPAVSYSKSASTTGPVAVGDTITYTLTTVVANSQTTAVTTLTDTLGTGLDFVAVGAQTSTDPANTTPFVCTGSLSCTLAAGTAPGTYTVSYTARVNAQAVGTVNNAVVGTNATCTTNCSTSTPVTAPAVSYSKSASTTGPVAVGDTITYTLTTVVANSQTTAVTTLTDTLGTGLDFVAVGAQTSTDPANTTPFVCTGSLSCTLAAGTAPGTYTVSYTARVNAQAVGTVNNAVVGTNATCTTNCSTSTPVTAPAVSYSKSVELPVGQTEVSAGDTLTYTLTATIGNSSTTALLTLTDTLGTGLTLGAVSAGNFSCGTANPLVCTLPSGTAPGTYSLTYTAIVNDQATGTVRNAVIGTGDDAPTCAGTCTTETPVTEPLPPLVTYAKSAVLPAGQAEVHVGDTVTYTLTTTVVNAVTTGDLVLTDTLGAGLTFGTVTNGGSYAANTSGAPVLTFTLPAGTVPGMYTVTYTATVNPQARGTVNNAVVGAGDDAPTCSGDCTTETPVAAPRVVVSKSSDPGNGAQVQVGQTVRYTLAVDVAGSALTQELVLVDTPDRGLTLGALPAGCAFDGTLLTCRLPAGTSTGVHPLTYDAIVNENAGAVVGNQVTASGGGGETPICTTCTTEHELDAPEIRLTKTAGSREVRIGDLVRYTLTVQNVGSVALINGSVVDTPAAGFSYVEGSLLANDADGMATVAGGNPLRFDGVDVAAGQSATLVYVMRVGAGVRPGTHVNQAQVRSATDDPISNIATAEVQLTADPLLDDSLVFGTVFNDRDSDGWQDSAALSGVKVQGGFAPAAYIANSTTVDRGAGPQPEPDASSPLLHGIAVGEISGRQSVADPVEDHEVVIRQRLREAAFTDDFVLTTAQGVTVRMDAAGTTRLEMSGDAAKGLTAAAPTVERRVAQSEGGYVVDYVIRNAGIDERGIPGVRIASVEGLLIETDQFGRYHLAGVPGGAWERGRNFILKVDPSTLPAGAEFTTDNPLLRRITPGVPVRFDWGVKLPEQVIEGGTKQVELEMGEVFFAPGSAEVREKYLPVVEAMAAKVREYQGGEVVIHANGDNEGLAFDRANAVKAALLATLDAASAKGLVVSVRGTVDDPSSMIVGVDEGGALLGTVLFDTDKSAIKPVFEPLLDKVAAALEKMGGGSIAIVGHTDVRASHAYNVALGMRRAKAVYEALAKRLSPEVRAKVRVEASNDPTAPVGVRK